MKWPDLRRGLRDLAAAALCLLCVAAVGCAGPSASRIRQYVVARTLDLADTVDLSVGAGPAVRAEVHYGLGVWGAGMGRSWRAGVGRQSGAFVERWISSLWLPPPLQPALALGFGRGAPALPEARCGLWGVAFVLTGCSGLDAIRPLAARGRNAGEFSRLGPWEALVVERAGDVSQGRTRFSGGSFSVGAAFDAGLGVRAMVYPIEVADFLCGLAGLDILGDDCEPE